MTGDWDAARGRFPTLEVPHVFHASRRLAPIALALVVHSTAARAQVPVYTVTDLGAVYGGGVHFAVAINDQGIVTSTRPSRHGFVWNQGQVTMLPDIEPSGASYTREITNAGRVIGISMVAVQSHATIWDGGILADLGVLGGIHSEANAGNESGLVVGSWQANSGGTDVHAFRWDSGSFTDLGGFGGSYSAAYDVNEAGTIVGGSRLADSGNMHAFVWTNGQMTDIGAWAGAGRMSIAYGINDAGVVTGILEPEFANGWLAFRYENGQMTTIAGIAGAEESVPEAINLHGQIVGWSQFPTGGEFATLFQDGVAYDLNTLIPPGSGWHFAGASDINDSGQIVGIGTYQGGTHGFLLTPETFVTRYCTSTVNSSGQACLIDTDGLPSVSRNQFDLVANGAVPNTIGLFFYNGGQQQLPFGNGYLCVGGGAPAIYRLGPPTVSNGSGTAVRTLDFDAAPAASGPGAIHPLATWNFQYYFRDPAAGGASFNLSDAISITFVP